MRARSTLAIVPSLFFIFLSCGRMAAQPSLCAHNLFCLFNQEATASAPPGIHKYSEDLIELLVPSGAGNSYTYSLANRLAGAEQMARTGKGELVPEAHVVRAFNELMKKIGAPSSLTTDEESVWRFRKHAASLNAFPALFSAERHGTNCNPGEAIFLLYLLISNNGVLSNQELDSAQTLMQMNSQQTERSAGVARMESSDSSASALIPSYATKHGRDATIALFNHTTRILGF